MTDFSKGNFTEYLLPEVLDLRGVYAKKLVPLLKEWKSIGKAVIPIEKLRTLLGIKGTYKINNIEQKVLKPAVKELKKSLKYKNLDYKKNKKAGHGNKIVSITFTFEPEISIKNDKLMSGVSPDSPDVKGIYPLEDLIRRTPINHQDYIDILWSFSYYAVRAFRKNNMTLEKVLTSEQKYFKDKYEKKFDKK